MAVASAGEHTSLHVRHRHLESACDAPASALPRARTTSLYMRMALAPAEGSVGALGIGVGEERALGQE
jgi:hypothetical protein